MFSRKLADKVEAQYEVRLSEWKKAVDDRNYDLANKINTVALYKWFREVAKGAYEVTARGITARSAVSDLNECATAYAMAAQTALQSALEVEDEVGSQEVADADADRLAEAKEAYENALRNFNSAMLRLRVDD